MHDYTETTERTPGAEPGALPRRRPRLLQRNLPSPAVRVEWALQVRKPGQAHWQFTGVTGYEEAPVQHVQRQAERADDRHEFRVIKRALHITYGPWEEE